MKHVATVKIRRRLCPRFQPQQWAARWSKVRHLLCDDEQGQSTVETAFGIAALTSVLLTAIAALVAVANYLAATDAAGSIARAEARGDTHRSSQIRSTFGGSVSVSESTDTITVTVTKKLAFMPISATATALVEGSITGAGQAG